MNDYFFKNVSCGHCSNIARMEIIGVANDKEEIDHRDYDPVHGPPPERGVIYSILRCPACNKINIASYFWHEFVDETDFDPFIEILYPSSNDLPPGLPGTIAAAYKAAEAVKTIDVNAYAILNRRLLEIVCKDRQASGNTLYEMLNDLAARKEMPEKLVNVAKNLRIFGNIGAHAGLGQLTDEETPIVSALSIAILEYLYSAPHLANLAEQKLQQIQERHT